MLGQAHWLTVMGPILAAAAIALLVYLAHHVASGYTRVSRSFECPVRHRPVHATLVRLGDRWTGVDTCSAFDPPSQVKCPKGCLSHLDSALVAP